MYFSENRFPAEPSPSSDVLQPTRTPCLSLNVSSIPPPQVFELVPLSARVDFDHKAWVPIPTLLLQNSFML